MSVKSKTKQLILQIHKPIRSNPCRASFGEACASSSLENYNAQRCRSISWLTLQRSTTSTHQNVRFQERCSRRRYATVAHTPQIMVNDLRHQEVLVAFDDDHTIRYPSFWLRDHCQCSECSHPHTKQRQLNTFSLDPDIKASDAVPKEEGLYIQWTHGDHKSLYPWSWLRQHVPFSTTPSIDHPRSKWQQVAPSSPDYPTVQFRNVMKTDSGLSTFLYNIRTFGLSFVAETPPTPEATQSLLERIAFIRVTHYGGFWDFTSEPKPIDTAYTNLELLAHTDNTYFTDPCGLQLFHCLRPATKGGESTFIDGFAAAKHLYKLNPDYYNILSSIRIASHASGDAKAGSIMNTASHPGGFPVFTHAVPHTRPHPNNLTQIRWNNDDRHSSTQWPSHERMIMWYRAARVWTEILASKDFEITVQLQPGKPVIFDNWRVLHGRKSFEGQRRMCGGYIGMDDFLARGRSLNGGAVRDGLEPKEEIHSQETANEERIAKEQLDEERQQQQKTEGGKERSIEPDVLPQQKQGVDQIIAS